MNSTSYTKRAGTSGIQGQLYETKLISLIYFRLTHDDSVEQFSLATNRDGIGEFDDVCFIANIKGFDKPLAVFLQAKHRENDKLLTFTSETDLAKYFSSYLKIRRTFDPSNKDMIFEGNFDDTECFFVMYTTTKGCPKNKMYEGAYAEYLNKLIGTGGCCTQPSYTDDDLDLLCKIVMKDQITTLATQLAKFICDESESEMSTNNDIMLRYHVILALNVFDVSEIQPEGHRIASFRQDFFTNNEVFIVLIKNILCLEVLKKQKSVENDVQSLLLKFLSEPSDVTTLSKLIGSVLTYKNDKIELISESITDDLQRQLDKANVPQATVYEAAELAAKEYLLSLKLKVPASFGNKDLTIRGDNKKIDKRLNYLTTKFIELLKQSEPNDIVTIDESLGDGFLQLNGGIACAVGNILVFDETSRLLKFIDNCESLGDLAKKWYEKLTTKIKKLHEYKLDIKVQKFPKLSFERGEYDMSIARDFYNKLLFYTNQATQNGVEKILREEIDNQPCSDVHNFKIRSELIFLKYHDEIQRLWLIPKVGSYLTEKSKVFENAVANAMSEPLMGVIKNMHNIKNKILTFNENAINRFAMQHDGRIIGTIIVSESCVLTVAKVEQYLGSKNHVVLDLEYILKLSLKNYNTLCKELTNTTKDHIFIIVCNPFRDLRDSDNRLENIAKAFDGKQIIVITNKTSVDIMKEYFCQNGMCMCRNVRDDDINGFDDLSVESQKKFFAAYNIKFQGKYVSLDVIIDDESAAAGLIDKKAFYELINDETVKIGNRVLNNRISINNSVLYDCNNYDKLFYIDRRVSRTKTQEHDKFYDVKDKVLETFYDLEDDVVLISGKQGMGKSTLLMYLSLKTKELDPKVWIVRINFRDQKDFSLRCNINEKIVTLVCQSALCDKSFLLVYDEGISYHIPEKDSSFTYYVSRKKNEHLKESPVEYNFSKANLCSCDPRALEIKFFLHYYNRGKLILLIDDFDERIPEHKEIVDECRKRKHRIWITSESPPSSNLQLWFGPSYKIENFSPLEQKKYLTLLWKFEIQFQNLYSIQDIEGIVDLMQTEHKEYLRAYVLFLEFLKAESMAEGFDFPYEEHYNRFKTKFGLCENTIPYFPDDITPRQLYEIAREFDENALNTWALFNLSLSLSA
ncbi:hypothetical protein PYW07_013313 [Mythimna separata]|uniref:Uncharacterized protein n=1 Tax=Mythimna separata TaxID=271217 RepID=A0AAD8DK51_MYTSE|nr:hypothetical protein PYW07_013313 [Mythimna separata]